MKIKGKKIGSSRFKMKCIIHPYTYIRIHTWILSDGIIFMRQFRSFFLPPPFLHDNVIYFVKLLSFIREKFLVVFLPSRNCRKISFFCVCAIWKPSSLALSIDAIVQYGMRKNKFMVYWSYEFVIIFFFSISWGSLISDIQLFEWKRVNSYYIQKKI